MNPSQNSPKRLVLAAAVSGGLVAGSLAAYAALPSAPRDAAVKAAPAAGTVLTGKDALGDWSTDAPGVRRHIRVEDLPPPGETRSVDNGPSMAPRPEGAMPKAPAGFTVSLYSSQMQNPRKIVTAPNGDVFVAESGPGRVRVLRGMGTDGKAQAVETFATNLHQPFGIAFYPSGKNPKYVYIGNTDSVVRFPYKNGDMKASAAEEMVVDTIPGGGRLRGGGHWTRDLAFSRDNKTMFVSVGSKSNNDDPDESPAEKGRADILSFTPDGKDGKIFAYGIRNAVGIAVHPQTGQLWMSVNERDTLGDHLVNDYISHVEPGGFYGWPYFYLGGHPDPRHVGKHPELKNKVIVPDVLVQSHSASLALTFYTGSAFPSDYKNDVFAAEHGSWNRSVRTGYKVVHVPLNKGKANGEYEDFLTGFVVDNGHVWGRPVGVTVANDGALLVSDDGSNSIWRVAYTGGKKAAVGVPATATAKASLR